MTLLANTVDAARAEEMEARRMADAARAELRAIRESIASHRIELAEVERRLADVRAGGRLMETSAYGGN